MKKICLCAILIGLWTGYASGDPAPLSVRDGHFVDADGREIILHGVNVGSKDPKSGYTPPHTEEDFARAAGWGFNLFRYLIFWAGVEPQPGVYDEAYLDRVAERVAWARQQGIYVLLDMHQDLWGGPLANGDGAPDWATLTDNMPNGKAGLSWGDAYFTSAAIHRAFGNFYANRPGPDGVGIQDHFAKAWAHVAQRFANDPNIAGLDILNEPSAGARLLLLPLCTASTVLQIVDEKEPGDMWDAALFTLSASFDQKARTRFFTLLDDRHAFTRLTQSAAPMFQIYERDKLQPMYQRVANAIRATGSKNVLFLEPHPGANIGVPCDLKPTTLADGSADTQIAFATHCYDLVTDSPDVDKTSTDRLEIILDQADRHARKHGAPLLIGEWGGFYGSPHGEKPARFMGTKFARMNAGDAYWDYEQKLGERAFAKELQRPYPQAVAGALTGYGFDYDDKVFECVWRENGQCKGDSVFYVPAAWYPNGCTVEIAPKTEAEWTLEPIAGPEPGNHRLHVPAAPEGGSRRVRISPK